MLAMIVVETWMVFSAMRYTAIIQLNEEEFYSAPAEELLIDTSCDGERGWPSAHPWSSPTGISWYMHQGTRSWRALCRGAHSLDSCQAHTNSKDKNKTFGIKRGSRSEQNMSLPIVTMMDKLCIWVQTKMGNKSAFGTPVLRSCTP